MRLQVIKSKHGQPVLLNFSKGDFFSFFFCIKTRFIMSFISQGSHDLALSKECVLLRIGTCFSWRENPEL